jgi:hypothetical protein
MKRRFCMLTRRHPAALRQVDDNSARRYAADIGEKIDREDGIGTTVKLIKAWGISLITAQ